MFRVMKGQRDGIARVTNEARDARDIIAGRGAAEEQRKTEVASLVRQYHKLAQAKDYLGAEKVAMQAKQLDPDNPAMGALAEMARMSRRVHDAEQIKANHEEMFREGLNAAERQGVFVDIDNPVKVQLESARRARLRGSGNDNYLRTAHGGRVRDRDEARQADLDRIQPDARSKRRSTTCGK